MTKKVDIFEEKPFVLNQTEKGKILLPEIRKMAKWHYRNCASFKKMCDNKNFNVNSDFILSDLPYFPISVLKELELTSVPKKQIVKTVYSSSTSGKPSKIMLDKITADNQMLVINKIMSNFFGTERRTLVVFDNEQTIKSIDQELTSRGTAIRGILPMAKKLLFILDKDLNLDTKKLKSIANQIGKNDKIYFFGFTWLIYKTYLNNKNNKSVLNFFNKISNQNNTLIHTGGWKKLKDMMVPKEDFNQRIAKMLKLKRENVIDFYGTTEQLGTIYPDCEYGYKHVPLYSEIIIRDFDTLKPAKVGESGLIQFISPVPHSYPGISLLSDDVGKIIGVDDCRCHRKGIYFVFEKRAEKAELKGCGDTLKI